MIPTPEPRTQRRREETLNGLVESDSLQSSETNRVSPTMRQPDAVHRKHRTLCKVALKARLQLSVGETHDPLNHSVAELVRGLPARQRRRPGSLPHDRSLDTSHSILWPNARPLPF